MSECNHDCSSCSKNCGERTEPQSLLVEQNAKMALGIADRAYVIETGKIVMTGTGEELLNSEDIKKAYLGG